MFAADVFAGFKECWLIVPEGNGKSTFVAVLSLYYAEFTDEAYIPVAAATREQAGIIYRGCDGFARRSGSPRYKQHPGHRRIVDLDRLSIIQVYASDVTGGDGVIPVGLAIIDELHRHKTLELYRTWSGKLDKEDAQLIVISTAGEPGGEFETVRETMRVAAVEKHVEGCFGRFVGEAAVLHEYAVPEGANTEDLVLVKAANPSARITVESLGKKRARPSWSLPHWQRLTCNVPTRETNAAVNEREWHEAATAEVIPAGAELWAGLDVGWAFDTTAFVPFWWRDEHHRQFAAARVFAPPRDGSQLDVNVLKRSVVELMESHRLSTVVMDSARAEDIAAWLSDDLGLNVVYRAQTTKPQTEDFERFMSALRNGWMFHAADAALTRHVLNAVARILPDGSVKFARPSDSRHGPKQDLRVIDALVAAAMVHSVAVEQYAGGAPWAGWE